MPRTKEQFEEIRGKTKQQILDAGLRVFSRKGFKGATISEIAKEAGVSKGLAYNYFSSKKELAEAILFQLTDLISQFEQIYRRVKDPYEILQIIIKETIRHIQSKEEFWRMYMSLFTQIEMAEIAGKFFGDMIEKFLKELEKVFRKIGVPNPKAEAYIFGAVLDGVPFDYFFDSENYPLKMIEKHLLKKYSRKELDKLK